MNTGNGARGAFAFFTGLSFRYEFVHVSRLCFCVSFFRVGFTFFGVWEWSVRRYSIFDIRYPIPLRSIPATP